MSDYTCLNCGNYYDAASCDSCVIRYTEKPTKWTPKETETTGKRSNCANCNNYGLNPSACACCDKETCYPPSNWKAIETEIKDSGERTEFATGAVRDMHTGKGRMDYYRGRQ